MIIVIGCGLAGLAVSLCLAQKGFQVDIVERREDFDSQGATFGLAPSGQKAMQIFCPEALNHLKSFGILLSTSGSYMLPWSEVRDALLERANANPNIVLRMGLKLASVQEDTATEQVIIKFSNSDLVLEGSVVIGADGVHSQVREIVGAKPAVPTGASIWRGRLNIADIPSLSHLLTSIDISKIYMFGPTAMVIFNFHTKLPGIIAWVVSTKATNIQHGITTPLDLIANETHSDKEVITTLLENAKEEDLKWSTELSVVNLEDGWGGKGRVTLVGDSAHALRPASGLGGSLAFEDAVILSQMLESSDDYVQSLREFEQKRLPRCKVISDDQTLRSEATYKKNVEIPPWSDEFVNWLNMGPDAPSLPPKNMYKVK